MMVSPESTSPATICMSTNWLLFESMTVSFSQKVLLLEKPFYCYWMDSDCNQIPVERNCQRMCNAAAIGNASW
jgi:hypothetical protein